MYKKFSKHLAVLLAIIMVVSLLPLSALASASEDPISAEPAKSDDPAPDGSAEPVDPPADPPADPPSDPPADPAASPVAAAAPAPGLGVSAKGEGEPENKPTHTVYIYADQAAAEAAAATGNADDCLVPFTVENGAALTADNIAAAELAVAAEGMKVDGWYSAASPEVPFVIGDVITGESPSFIFLYPKMVEDDGEEGEEPPEDDGVPIMVSFAVDGVVVRTSAVGDDGKVSPIYLAPNQYPENATTFLYWYTTDDAVAFDFSTEITGDLTLNAKFEQVYLIKYKRAPGDDENLVIQTLRLGPDNVIPQLDPANADKVQPPENMHVSHWYVEGEDETVAFAFGVTKPTKDMTLVPDFSNEYYVFFVSAGTQVPFQLVKGGEKAAAPADPTRAGYTFNGWATDAEGGTKVDFATYTINEDTTFYAAWTPQTTNYKIVYWREKANIPGDPGQNKDNYEFYASESRTALSGTVLTVAGLNLKDDAVAYSTYKFTDKALVEVAGNGTTVINVYFSRIEYTFVFDLNPGTNDNTNRNGATMVFKGATYAQGVDADGGTLSGNQYSFKAKYEQDIEAIWPSSWNATLEKTTRTRSNGSSSWRNPTTSSFTSWSSTGISNAFVSKRFTVTANMVPASGTTRTFTANWGSTNTREVEYWLEALPNEIGIAFTFNNVTKNYVKSEAHSQSIDLSGSLSAKTIEGVKHVGTSNQPTSGTVTTYRFFYDRNRYTLSFDTQGGSAISSSTLMYGEDLTDKKPADPTRVLDGVTYAFAFWSLEADDPDGLKKFEFDDKTMPNGNLELFAQYTSQALTVNFYGDLSGTEGSYLGAVNTGIGSYLKVNEAYCGYEIGKTVEGKGVFNGWYIKQGNSYFRFSYDTPITTDLNLYAGFDTSGFKLTYDLNGGTGIAPVDGDSYYIGKEARLDYGENVDPPAQDEVLVGWELIYEGDESGTVYVPGSIVPIFGHGTLKAVYGKITAYVQVIYHSNYPGNTPDISRTQWVKKNTDQALLGEIFTLNDARMYGWSVNSGDDNEVTNAFGSTVNIGTVLNLYGVWAASGYTVTFTAGNNGLLNDGNANQSEVVFPADSGQKWSDAVTVPAPVPSDGYYFDGWSPVLPAADYPITSNLSYTANFKPVTAITLTATSADFTYDGTEKANAVSPSPGYTITGGILAAGHTIASDLTALASATNAGSYTVNFNKAAEAVKIFAGNTDVTDRYKITLAPGTLTITKRAVTITAYSGAVTYDGNNHEYTNYFTVAVDGFTPAVTYTNNLPTDGIPLLAGDKLSGVSAAGAIQYPWQSGQRNVISRTGAQLSADDVIADNESANYTFTFTNGTLTMASPDGGIPWVISIANEVLAYNGETQTNENDYTINLPEGFEVTGIDFTPASGKNVGVSTNDATPAIYYPTFGFTGIGITLSGAVLTDYFAQVPTIDPENEGTLVITPVEVEVKVTTDPMVVKVGESPTFTHTPVYDAFVNGEDAAVALRVPPAFAVEGFTTPAAIGSYAVKMTTAPVANYGNYIFVGPDGEAAVAGTTYPDVKVVPTGSVVYHLNDYDGITMAGQSVPDTKSGNKAGDVVELEFSATNPGWTFIGWSTEWSIDAKIQPVVYAEGGDETLTFPEITDDNEGIVNLYAQWERNFDDPNYAFSVKPYSGVYDGRAHSVTLVNTKPSDRFTFTYDDDGASTTVTVNPSFTNVTLPDRVDITVNATNGTAAAERGSFVKITPRSVVVRAQSYSIKAGTPAPDYAFFTETPFGVVRGDDLNIENNLYSAYDDSADDFRTFYTINAKTSTWDNPNYKVTFVDGLLLVTTYSGLLGNVEIVAASDEKPYDGTALENPNYTVKIGRFVNAASTGGGSVTFQLLSETYTVTAATEGSQTKIGSSPNAVTTYNIVDSKGVNMNKYFSKVKLTDGTLTVTPGEDDIWWEDGGDPDVEITSVKKIYDGITVTPVIAYNTDNFDDAAAVEVEYSDGSATSATPYSFKNVVDTTVAATVTVGEESYPYSIPVLIDPRPFAAQTDDVAVTYNGDNQQGVSTTVTDTSTLATLTAAYADTDGYTNYADEPFGLLPGDSITARAVSGMHKNAATYPMQLENISEDTSTGAIQVFYTINDENDGKNYVGEPGTGTFTISKARLTLTAGDLSIDHNAALPSLSSFSYQVPGLVKNTLYGNDKLVGNSTMSVGILLNSSDIPYASVVLQCKDYAVGESGKFPIKFANAYTAKNYDVATVNGTLTVGDPGTPPGDPPAGEIIPGGGGPIIPPAEPPAEPPVTLEPAENPAAPADPTTQLTDEVIPQAQLGAWALLNLMVAVLTLVFAILLVATAFKRNKAKEETEEEQKARMAAKIANGEEPEDVERNKKSGLLWRIIAIIAGIAAPIVFLLTENIRLPMQFVDRWTLLMVIILVAQVIGMLLMKRARNQEESSDEEQPTKA